MSYRIRCYTLFDITKSGILNRKPPVNSTEQFIIKWERERNTQCNFDTIIQVTSLRSQPEEITVPKQTTVKFTENQYFGFAFDNEEDQKMWSFEFTVNHKSVYDDGISELGSLLTDCVDVPMIKVGTEWDKLPTFLDTTPELRNIYFEIIQEF